MSSLLDFIGQQAELTLIICADPDLSITERRSNLLSLWEEVL
jgi:hypothetical protein